VALVEKRVEFVPGEPPRVYHCLAQPDYITILARTRSGLVALVRQFRPAVEEYTWELPAGLLEDGEDPEEACRRELKEETGLDAVSVTKLGSFWSDTGRHENHLHAFFVEASDPDPSFVPETGMEVRFVRPGELWQEVQDGRFKHQLHLGLLALAQRMKIVLD
jgi:8-oxo-dGTP pyrophosphatase MutT (NUDIX family)